MTLQNLFFKYSNMVSIFDRKSTTKRELDKNTLLNLHKILKS